MGALGILYSVSIGYRLSRGLRAVRDLLGMAADQKQKLPNGVDKDFLRSVGDLWGRAIQSTFAFRKYTCVRTTSVSEKRRACRTFKYHAPVESRRGAVPLASRWRLARFSPRRLSPVWRGSVSSSRSSHRTCGFPASGARRKLTVSPTEGWRSVR